MRLQFLIGNTTAFLVFIIVLQKVDPFINNLVTLVLELRRVC
jgi:hypothetical protein